MFKPLAVTNGVPSDVLVFNVVNGSERSKLVGSVPSTFATNRSSSPSVWPKYKYWPSPEIPGPQRLLAKPRPRTSCGLSNSPSLHGCRGNASDDSSLVPASVSVVFSGSVVSVKLASTAGADWSDVNLSPLLDASLAKALTCPLPASTRFDGSSVAVAASFELGVNRRRR